jgi:hypothetical protein
MSNKDRRLMQLCKAGVEISIKDVDNPKSFTDQTYTSSLTLKIMKNIKEYKEILRGINSIRDFRDNDH